MTFNGESAASNTVECAFDAFVSGNVKEAHEMLELAVENAEMHNKVEEVFNITCMNASIAAMEGSNDIVSIMRHSRAHPEHDSITLYLEGLSAMAKNNLQTARIKFEEAKRRDKYLVIANLGLAAIQFENKKYSESFALYREVLSVLGSELTPSVVRIGMGLCAYYLHNLEFAQKCLERALEIDLDNELALFALLVVYLERRLFAKVTSTVVRLRHILPHNALIMLKVGDLLYFKAISDRRLKHAQVALTKLLDKVYLVGTAEECALADFQLGRLALACNDLQIAQRYLESSLTVLPELLSARIHYARLLLLRKQENEGLQLLTKINKEHPGQQEVLMLLALYTTQHGQHEQALQYCHSLMNNNNNKNKDNNSNNDDNVEEENVSRCALSAWCSRVDAVKCKQLFSHLVGLYHSRSVTPPWQVLANVAVLSKDVKALQGFIDRDLGGNFMEYTHKVEHKYIPLLYNLALLLEEEDQIRAKAIYVFLVKCQSHFTLPYFRLHLLAYKEKQFTQSVAWLTLLCQIAPQEPMAQTYLAQRFFAQRRIRASMNILRLSDVNNRINKESNTDRSNHSLTSSSNRKSTPIMLTLGALYLWCCQQRGRDDSRFLKSAKEHFLFVLRNDHGNILAAHGMACCLGLEGDFDHCQSLLNHVGEVDTNYQYVLSNHSAHMANVKMISESYKSAMDYLERIRHRTCAQDSLLAFCLTCQQRFDEAITLLSNTLSKWDKSTGKQQQEEQEEQQEEWEEKELLNFKESKTCQLKDVIKLIYNLGLLHCTSFLRHIIKSSSMSLEEGRKVRNRLENGITLAIRFLHNPTSRTTEMRVCRVFIKSVCEYCLRVYELSLERLLLIGKESEMEQIREAEHWAETYKQYQSELTTEEQRKEIQLTQERAAHEDAGKEVLEHFKQRRESDPLKLFDPDLIAASLAEIGNAPPLIETETDINRTAEAILAGMQLDLPNNIPDDGNNDINDIMINNVNALDGSAVTLKNIDEHNTENQLEH